MFEAFLEAAREAATRVHPNNARMAEIIMDSAEQLHRPVVEPLDLPTHNYSWHWTSKIMQASNVEDLYSELDAITCNAERSQAYRYVAARLAKDGQFTEALTIADGIAYPEFKVEAFLDVARYQIAGRVFTNALETLMIAESVGRDISSPVKQAFAHRDIAGLRHVAGDDCGARQSILDGLKVLTFYKQTLP
ncbi:MAG: hypothetical protein WAO98_08410 [Alphaproteobacteria bacterium]